MAGPTKEAIVMGNSSARDKKLIYHLTAMDNLAEIRRRGLLSRSECQRRQLGFHDVANPEILDGREDFGLDCMVPFHFIHKNPFDYAVVRNNPGTEFVLLAFSRQYAQVNGWKIIPIHPLANDGQPTLLEWKAGMQAIDWYQMDRPDRDYHNDHDCKMTCMAEALSPVALPLEDCAMIFVTSAQAMARAASILGTPLARKLTVNAQMFPGAG